MQETKELKNIEVKTIDDLQKIVNCRLYDGENIEYKDGTLFISSGWLIRTEGFHGILNVALYELLEAGIIRNYYFFVPNWLWKIAEKVDLKKIGWYVAVVEVQE